MPACAKVRDSVERFRSLPVSKAGNVAAARHAPLLSARFDRAALVRYYENAPTHAWVLMPSAAVKFLFRVVACDGYDPVVSRVRRL